MDTHRTCRQRSDLGSKALERRTPSSSRGRVVMSRARASRQCRGKVPRGVAKVLVTGLSAGLLKTIDLGLSPGPGVRIPRPPPKMIMPMTCMFVFARSAACPRSGNSSVSMASYASGKSAWRVVRIGAARPSMQVIAMFLGGEAVGARGGLSKRHQLSVVYSWSASRLAGAEAVAVRRRIPRSVTSLATSESTITARWCSRSRPR